MKTRWTIAAAIAVSYAATTGWQVIAQETGGANAPADLAEAPIGTHSLQSVQEVIEDHQGRNAEPVKKNPAIGELDARATADLEEAFARLDEQAKRTADELRQLQEFHGPRHRGVAMRRDSLRAAVARLFEIRQQLQRRELAEYQSRLARAEQQIAARESLKVAIIDRRVEELIKPALAWGSEESAGAATKEIGGLALPAEPAAPKETGLSALGDERTDPTSRLRERFISRFPDTVAPEVAGKYTETSLHQFVDISPARDLAVTVRRVDNGSYTCALWDFETGRHQAAIVRPGTAATVRFSANGQFIGVHKFLSNEVDVFEVPIGNTVHNLLYEPPESWEAAFNRFADDQAATARDPAGASKPSEDVTVLSVDNQRELAIISAGSVDGMRQGMTLRVHQGSTYLGRVTVIKTNQDTSLVRIEEENAAMPIRRGDRVTAAPPRPAEGGAARLTARALAWDLLGTKLGEYPAFGQYQGGLSIEELRAHGPAAQAKLRVGDVLVGLDSWETKSLADLRFALENPDARPHPGQANGVKAYVVRDGETMWATLTIATSKDGDRAASPPSPPSNETSSWPHVRGGPQMTGVAAAPLPDDLSLLWYFRAENRAFENAAAIAEGVAYLGDRNGALYALDMNSGEKRWEFRLEDQDAGFWPAERKLGSTKSADACSDRPPWPKASWSSRATRARCIALERRTKIAARLAVHEQECSHGATRRRSRNRLPAVRAVGANCRGISAASNRQHYCSNRENCSCFA